LNSQRKEEDQHPIKSTSKSNNWIDDRCERDEEEDSKDVEGEEFCKVNRNWLKCQPVPSKSPNFLLPGSQEDCHEDWHRVDGDGEADEGEGGQPGSRHLLGVLQAKVGEGKEEGEPDVKEQQRLNYLGILVHPTKVNDGEEVDFKKVNMDMVEPALLLSHALFGLLKEYKFLIIHALFR